MAIHLKVPLKRKTDDAGEKTLPGSNGSQSRRLCFKQTDSGSYEQRLAHFQLEAIQGLVAHVLRRNKDGGDGGDGATAPSGVCHLAKG